MKIFISFFITLIAGLSTIIGWFFVLYKPKDIKSFLGFCLSFSAGIMFGICILDLIPTGFIYISNKYNPILSIFIALFAFFVGFGINYIFSSLITLKSHKNSQLYNLGIISMIGMVIHNIPEGILTFLSSNIDISLGIKYALAIMLHNIPEGIIISMPIYYATGNKMKAFFLTLMSGFSELIGGFISFIFLKQYLNYFLISIVLLIVAGLMISIVIDDIWREIKKYPKNIYLGFIFGILFNIILIFLQ